MNQRAVECAVFCGCSDQLVVQTEGAVVLGVWASVHGGGQCQGEGVPVGEFPDTCSEVPAQTGELGGRRGYRRGWRRGGGSLGNRPGGPVRQGSVWGCRREFIARGLPGCAGQGPPLKPSIRGCPGCVGTVWRRGRGEITQCWGKGKRLVFVMRWCLEGKTKEEGSQLDYMRY